MYVALLRWQCLLLQHALTLVCLEWDCCVSQVDQTQEDTEEAKSHLKRLAVKAVTSKLCLLFVILCLIAAIAVVSYYKWYPRSKKDYIGILPTTPAPAPSSGR